MAFFEFPHTRTYDNDLGWLIKKVIEMSKTLDNFVHFNTIKYADPISWSIATQYEANTVVVNAADGTAYISTQPVPSGVLITNTDYWTPIFNYGESLNELREQIAAANEGSSGTATAPRIAGELVWLNDELYQVIYDLPIGTAYIPGTNVEKVTVETLISALKEYVETAVAAVKKGVINVKDYGASGNGVTDDTEAIQAALDEAAENGYAVSIPEGRYLVSTLWVRSNAYIFGTGTLQAYPLRYDVTTENVAAGSNTIPVGNGGIYRKNMVLTIKKPASTEVVVVTDVVGNELQVKTFRYYDGMAGSDYLQNAYPVGSEIHINTVPLVITAHIHTVPTDGDASSFIITSCVIDGVSVNGARSGYDHSKYSIYDLTLNGCIFAYRVSGLHIKGGNFGNCYNNAIAIVGRSRGVHVEGCRVSNVDVPGDITAVDLKDTGGGILFHWDQRDVAASEIPTMFMVDGCEITSCYCGIFASSARYGTISNNKVTECKHHGIEVYAGDLGYGTYDIVITGNTVSGVVNTDGTVGNGIDLFSATRCTIAENIVVQCQRGISARIASLCSVDVNKIISCTDTDIWIGRMDGRIAENILTSGAGCRATVEIDNQTAINISLLEFRSNYFTGYNTLNAAINILSGQNIASIGDYCNIRALFKIAVALSAANNIRAYNSIIYAQSGALAITSGERAKIFAVGVYVSSLNVVITAGAVGAKTTAERDAWVDPTAGSLVFNTTTGTLQVYNGSGWTNV